MYLEVPYSLTDAQARTHTRARTHSKKVKSMAMAPYCTKEWGCLDLLGLHLHGEPSPARTGSH